MFSMGGLFALYEGIEKIRHPHEADNLEVAIGILLFAVALEAYSLRTAVKEANHVKPKSMGWMTFIRRSKSPELPTVLLEDFAAEIGLVIALIGVVLARITHNARWDAAGSIAIGVLLIVVAFVLAREMKGLLIGESADQDIEATITAQLTGSPSVSRLIHLRTVHVGPDELLVAAKLEFDRSLSVDQLAAVIDVAEARLRAQVPSAIHVYLEPDIFRDEVAE